jgi:hypothetical protein
MRLMLVYSSVKVKILEIDSLYSELMLGHLQADVYLHIYVFLHWNL